jgi:hypothetical protein
MHKNRNDNGQLKSYSEIAQDNNLEVFHCPDDYPLEDENGEPVEPGFYWWSCSPGCIPDGEPIGPYDTEHEATAEAIEPFLDY